MKDYNNDVCVYLQLSFSEIGTLLNISESNAKVLYHRGKEKLKAYM